MIKNRFDHKKIQDLVFGNGTKGYNEEVKEKKFKKVLSQFNLEDEYGYFEKIEQNRNISKHDKVKVFLESFDELKNNNYLKNKLSKIYLEEDDSKIKVSPSDDNNDGNQGMDISSDTSETEKTPEENETEELPEEDSELETD